MRAPTPTTIRLPSETLAGLKQLALRVSLKRGKQIGWSQLIREAAANLLEQEGSNQSSDLVHRH